eukprot:882891-Pleurochrysis_carterae.AAC.1
MAPAWSLFLFSCDIPLTFYRIVRYVLCCVGADPRREQRADAEAVCQHQGRQQVRQGLLPAFRRHAHLAFRLARCTRVRDASSVAMKAASKVAKEPSKVVEEASKVVERLQKW